jgi:periplasmic protein TonB
MRKTKRKLVIPFAVAVVFNAMVVLCADRILVVRVFEGGAMPAFQQGDSSIEVALLSPTSSPEEPVPEQASPQPPVIVPEPTDVRAPDSVPVVAEPVENHAAESSQTAYLGATASGTTAAGTNYVTGSGENELGEGGNADALDKGVQGGAYPAVGIRPVYPLGPRMRGEEGTVTLQAQVDASGSARTVTVSKSSGYSGLDNAAAKAVKKARFVPASRDGKPQDSETVLTVRFQLVE